MNNITLIGMPGAGKSSIGVVLAKVLGYQFIDSDLLIQKAEKRTLSKIIEDEGTEGFKAIENRVNASIQVENTVIATGGSVVYCDEAMQHLKSEGVVVYLKISGWSFFPRRLGNLKGRGVVLKRGRRWRVFMMSVFLCMRNMRTLWWMKRIRIWRGVSRLCLRH